MAYQTDEMYVRDLLDDQLISLSKMTGHTEKWKKLLHKELKKRRLVCKAKEEQTT